MATILITLRRRAIRKSLMLIRRLFGDRFYDRVIMSQI